MEANLLIEDIVKVDSEKCTNCHVCIGACPVKYCNDASDISKGIIVNAELCINCGSCIKACTHDARYYVDDIERFLEDLKNGEQIAALVAPATEVNFPNQLNKLLGWLKTIGVKMNFDVSLGAEITTYQYLQALKAGVKTPIIAQPCPSVVSYIEKYKPYLIEHLAPTGSPTLDMASWVHHNHPGMKLAFISPCVAKKVEIEDNNTQSKVSYNVTIAKLKEYFEKKNIDLNQYEEANFDGPLEAEKGILYSQPGGLFETLKRYNYPLKINQVRRTEGLEIYEEFFEELEDEIKRNECDVLVVDILNCLHGCNRGTGTIYSERTTNDVLKLQAERLEKQQNKYYNEKLKISELEELLSNMNDIDFSRSYTDKTNYIKKLEEPDEEMIEIINQQMGKFEAKDIKNCGACGYASCEKMAKAVLNGLYRPQQCHHFLEKYYIENSGDIS